jgi:hypothetical protein
MSAPPPLHAQSSGLLLLQLLRQGAAEAAANQFAMAFILISKLSIMAT